MAKKSKNTLNQTRSSVDEVLVLRKENEALKVKLSRISAPTKRKSSPWRAFTAGLLAILAVLSIGIFNISFWVKDTVVNTNQFTTTLQPLIKDPAIQKTLQTEISKQIFSQIDLEAELKKALPENLSFIAGPFVGQVQSFTYGKIGDLLNSEQAYNVWAQTLRLSHEKILAYIQNPNNSGVLTVNNLYELAGQQLKSSDVGFLFGKSLPSSVGSIQLADIKGVPKARQAIYGLEKVTRLLGLASVLFAILAIAMASKRRNMVIGLAVFTLLFMLSTLLAISLAGPQISAQVQPQFKDATLATYAIITAPLVTQTQGVAALIGAAILVAIATSSWDSIVWLRSQLRESLDWFTKKTTGTWARAQWVKWIALNRVVIGWTLVAVSFAAFALRIPPTVSGVEQAFIASAIVAAFLELFASISRTSKQTV
jgi:hypothetical protein